MPSDRIDLTVTARVKNDAVTREAGRMELALILAGRLHDSVADLPWVIDVDVTFVIEG